MKNGFVKVAAAVPAVRPADTVLHTDELIRLSRQASAEGVAILLFPELSITGYTCGDLFSMETLQAAAEEGLTRYLEETRDLSLLSIVGLPFVKDHKRFDCAAVCFEGRLLGLVPKCYPVGHGDAYETRVFASTETLPAVSSVSFNGQTIPFGQGLLFVADSIPSLRISVVVGSDALAPCPISQRLASAGATLICNPTARTEIVGNRAYLSSQLQALSSRLHASYLSVSCGNGESTTDSVYSGHCLICENGTVLAENHPFDGCELLCSEIDVELLSSERQKQSTYPTADGSDYLTIPFSLPLVKTPLTRFVDPHPFLPSDPTEYARRCELILNIQAHGLKKRMEAAYAAKLVLGISGGLDSTLAILVAARALELAGRPMTDLVAVTMPCFGTTKRTKSNATLLCEALGVDFRCVDISKSVTQHFADISQDINNHDVTFENGQARERTQVLMDIANQCNGLVVGTGDLSELALGWATYNGDHMSMYGVNGSIPKTLVRHLVSYYAEQVSRDERITACLRDVLDTPVSPELLPANASGEIAQKTEDLVGPYELHDFYLYYLLRYGFSPEKLFRLAKRALGDQYDDEALLKWLEVLLRRFFSQQFKRSCLPDGPAVGSVGLSPRTVWKMPSDAVSKIWLGEVQELKKAYL